MAEAPPAWGPVLSGPRVRLTPIDPPLARAMLRGAPGPELAWERGFPMVPLLDIARRIAASSEPLGPFLAYAIVRRADGLAIGDAGFHGPPDTEGSVEIGYALVPAARGAGFAVEAAGLLVEWARRQPAVRAILARVEPGNLASERLLARLGFAPEGDADGLRRFALRRARPPHARDGPAAPPP